MRPSNASLTQTPGEPTLWRRAPRRTPDGFAYPTRATEQADQRARNEQRERLRAKPEARRAYLQEKHLRFHDEHLAQFGEAGATALYLLLKSTEPMSDVESDAFAAIVRQLGGDPLEAEPAPEPEPRTWADTEAVASLVDVYRQRQRAQL